MDKGTKLADSIRKIAHEMMALFNLSPSGDKNAHKSLPLVVAIFISLFSVALVFAFVAVGIDWIHSQF